MEHYKAVKESLQSRSYIVMPTSAYMRTFPESGGPYSCIQMQAQLFNYSFRDFLKYLIINFKATIKLQKSYPFFLVTFDEIGAKQFAEELNRRMSKND